MELEAPGHYFLQVDVPQWVTDVPDYLHKIDIGWLRDKSLQTRDDSLYTALNWRPVRDKTLRLVMLRHSDALQSPYPTYTERDIRDLESNKE
jgi:hypothetical protein